MMDFVRRVNIDRCTGGLHQRPAYCTMQRESALIGIFAEEDSQTDALTYWPQKINWQAQEGKEESDPIPKLGVVRRCGLLSGSTLTQVYGPV